MFAFSTAKTAGLTYHCAGKVSPCSSRPASWLSVWRSELIAPLPGVIADLIQAIRRGRAGKEPRDGSVATSRRLKVMRAAAGSAGAPRRLLHQPDWLEQQVVGSGRSSRSGTMLICGPV